MPDHDILSSPQGRRLLQQALGRLDLESIARSGADDAVKRILTELRRARRARSRKVYAFWAAVLTGAQRRSGNLSVPAGCATPARAEHGSGRLRLLNAGLQPGRKLPLLSGQVPGTQASTEP